MELEGAESQSKINEALAKDNNHCIPRMSSDSVNQIFVRDS